MTNNEYIANALRTDSVTPEMVARFHSADTIILLKKAIRDFIAMSKVLDIFKRHLFYGKDLTLISKFYSPGTVGPDLGHRLELSIRKLHAAIGLATETGEIFEALFGSVFHGVESDTINLVEEGGDVFWYLAIFADAVGVTFEEMQERNARKLRIRYPQKFEESQALTRDLPAERKALECANAMPSPEIAQKISDDLQLLIKTLLREAKNGGEESLVDTLQRIIKERDAARQQVSHLTEGVHNAKNILR